MSYQDDRKTVYHGKANKKYKGITSRLNKYDGQHHYTINYRWKPATERQARLAGGTAGKAIKVRELVPPNSKGKHRLEDALKLMQTRNNARRGTGWVPPHIEAKIEAEREAAEAELEAAKGEQRAPLLWEAAVERYLNYLTDVGRSEESIGQSRSHLGTAGRFFGGKMLDEITVADVNEFFLRRLKQQKPFDPVWRKNPVSIRAAEADLAKMGAMYRWLMRVEGRTLANPCIRPTDEGKGSLLGPYRPKRSKVIPDDDTLIEIFVSRCRARPGGQGAAGRDLITDKHRALWMLVYSTGARPESEPCRLTYGDVCFLKDGWATVDYRDPKNPQSERTLPVFPEAAAALRGIMTKEEPSRADRAAHDAWAATLVFERRGVAGGPWDHHSYAAAWKAVLRNVEGIEGMVVRDLRATAYTRMRRAGVDYTVRQRVLGHALPKVEGAYSIVDPNDIRLAVEVLRPTGLAEHMNQASNLAPHLAPTHRVQRRS